MSIFGTKLFINICVKDGQSLPMCLLTIDYGLDMQEYCLFYSKTYETIFTNYIQTKILLVQRFSSSAILKKQMIIEFFYEYDKNST